jgi:hypothetical protein
MPEFKVNRDGGIIVEGRVVGTVFKAEQGLEGMPRWRAEVGTLAEPLTFQVVYDNTRKSAVQEALAGHRRKVKQMEGHEERVKVRPKAAKRKRKPSFSSALIDRAMTGEEQAELRQQEQVVRSSLSALRLTHLEDEDIRVAKARLENWLAENEGRWTK